MQEHFARRKGILNREENRRNQLPGSLRGVVKQCQKTYQKEKPKDKNEYHSKLTSLLPPAGQGLRNVVEDYLLNSCLRQDISPIGSSPCHFLWVFAGLKPQHPNPNPLQFHRHLAVHCVSQVGEHYDVSDLQVLSLREKAPNVGSNDGLPFQGTKNAGDFLLDDCDFPKPQEVSKLGLFVEGIGGLWGQNRKCDRRFIAKNRDSGSVGEGVPLDPPECPGVAWLGVDDKKFSR